MVKTSDVFQPSQPFTSTEIMENSRAVAQDYIAYRLNQNQIVWENGRQGNVTPSAVESAMRNLGDEFEERFRNRFDDMIRQLHVTRDNARDTFFAIVGETFADGINWGRIVALFGFAGRFAIQCCNNNMNDMVDNIVDWVSNYTDNHLFNWMDSHNGWNGFLEFHRGGAALREENAWSPLKTIGSCLAMGVGVLTLGAFLTQKSWWRLPGAWLSTSF